MHDQSGHGEGRSVDRRKMEGGDDNLSSTNEEMPDHYIYVAYPPELKRRLLERYLLELYTGLLFDYLRAYVQRMYESIDAMLASASFRSCYNRTTRL